MKWILAHWGWLTGGGLIVVAIVAFAMLNLPAFLRLASSLAGWAMDAGKGAIQWARKDGWRAACVLAAVLCIGQTWRVQQAQQQAVATEAARIAIQAERDTALGQVTVVTGERDKANADFAAYKAQIADEYRATTERAKAQQEASAAAVADAKRREREAESSMAGWLKQYRNKSEACRAVIEALDVNCGNLTGY